jgi:hypothetical protein
MNSKRDVFKTHRHNQTSVNFTRDQIIYKLDSNKPSVVYGWLDEF